MAGSNTVLREALGLWSGGTPPPPSPSQMDTQLPGRSTSSVEKSARCMVLPPESRQQAGRRC
eukprot:scaffold158956_cov30-Tisochrysis_lutea.AAC.1